MLAGRRSCLLGGLLSRLALFAFANHFFHVVQLPDTKAQYDQEDAEFEPDSHAVCLAKGGCCGAGASCLKAHAGAIQCGMSDEYQIEIPASFMALFVLPGRQKPSLPRDELAARYELCEDMAQLLTETARNMEFSLGLAESDVLTRCLQGLRVEPAVVSDAESVWVVRRLAELLGWSDANLQP
jgi:hypothetical protein